MNGSEPLDLYCEHTDASLWAEPINAIDQRRLILAAGAVFTRSLFLRTVDRELCDLFWRGTHFVWNLLNAATLYLLLRSGITARDAHMPS